MLFSSSVFLFLFLPIVLILYFNPIVKNRIYRNIILLVASLFFYAWGEPVYVFLLLAMAFADWILALYISAQPVRSAAACCSLSASSARSCTAGR